MPTLTVWSMTVTEFDDAYLIGSLDQLAAGIRDHDDASVGDTIKRLIRDGHPGGRAVIVRAYQALMDGGRPLDETQ